MFTSKNTDTYIFNNEKLFDDFFNNAFNNLKSKDNTFLMTKGQNNSMIKSNEECLKIIVDMPGINKEDIEVSLEQNDRVIAKGKTGVVEFEYIYLVKLSDFDLKETKLDYNNGVLTISLFKNKNGEGGSLVFKL